MTNFSSKIVESILPVTTKTLDNDWGVSDFPLVLGHEGIGTVRRVGDAVVNLKVGDVVGMTWIRDSCGACARCLEGRENV